MSEPRKDGLDRGGLWPTVYADNWQEAFALGAKATEPTVFSCPNGVTITFTGAKLITPLCKKPPAPKPD